MSEDDIFIDPGQDDELRPEAEAVEADEHRRVRGRGRSRRLVSTAALPAMCTLLNGLAGFASMHFAAKDALGDARLLNLQIAAWLILAAMIFDMLDGRLARLTRQTSDFGAQLDSLCDAISFGAAPAMLMLRTVTMAMRGPNNPIDVRIEELTRGVVAMERVFWCVAAVYVACAVLRLARFNVETSADESAHMDFRGLPSPGAAAAVTTMVLLFTHLVPRHEAWQASTWVLVAVTLAVATLAAALLMVSRFRYPHLVNQYIRSRRPFGYLVKLVLVFLAAIINFYVTVAAATVAYAAWGPVAATWRQIRSRFRKPADKTWT